MILLTAFTRTPVTCSQPAMQARAYNVEAPPRAKIPKLESLIAIRFLSNSSDLLIGHAMQQAYVYRAENIASRASASTEPETKTPSSKTNPRWASVVALKQLEQADSQVSHSQTRQDQVNDPISSHSPCLSSPSASHSLLSDAALDPLWATEQACCDC